MALNNYDPTRVTLSFKGVLITGFAADTFILAERAEDTFSTDVGAQGDVTRIRSRNKTGSVTVTLMAGSPTNDRLSAIIAEDELVGTGYGAMLMKDLNGTTLCSSAFAWLRRPANVERGSGASNVEWVIDCERLEMLVGGFVS